MKLKKYTKKKKKEKNTNNSLAEEYDMLASEYYERLNNSEDDWEVIDNCDKYTELHEKVVEHYEDKKNNGEFDQITKTMDSNISSVYYKSGFAYFNIQEYEIALESFKCVLCYNIKGDESDIYFNIGACYSELKDYFKAYENFKKAYELNKNNTKAQKFANDVLEKLRLE